MFFPCAYVTFLLLLSSDQKSRPLALNGTKEIKCVFVFVSCLIRCILRCWRRCVSTLVKLEVVIGRVGECVYVYRHVQSCTPTGLVVFISWNLPQCCSIISIIRVFYLLKSTSWLIALRCRWGECPNQVQVPYKTTCNFWNNCSHVLLRCSPVIRSSGRKQICR